MDKEISKFSRCIRREKYYKQLLKGNQIKEYMNTNIKTNKKNIDSLRNIVYLCSQNKIQLKN